MYLEQIDPASLLNGIGGLSIIAGGMKADKTGTMLRFFDRLKYAGVPSQLFKPACDVRAELLKGKDNHYLASRGGLLMPGHMIDDKGDLKDFDKMVDPNARAYGFDEVHLFDQPEEVAQRILKLVNIGKYVVASILDKDFRGEIYPVSALLLAHATTIDKKFGICDLSVCNNVGEFSQKLINGEPAPYDSPVKQVGASETYEVRCRPHHEAPGKPKDNLTLEFKVR
jgi:thymidine kinase